MKETLQFLKCCVSYKVLHPILIGEDLKEKEKSKDKHCWTGGKEERQGKVLQGGHSIFSKNSRTIQEHFVTFQEQN